MFCRYLMICFSGPEGEDSFLPFFFPLFASACVCVCV